MKKTIIILATLLFAISAVSAQTSFGIKLGGNLANLTGDGDSDIRLSIHGGGVAEIDISEKLSVQPELLYSGQGAKFGDLVLAFDYIQLPILVQYMVINGLTIQAGPQIGYNLSAKIKSDGNSDDYKDFAKALGQEFNDFDFGAAVGAQFQTKLGLFFQARYNMGFLDFIKDGDSKNAVISISVGYMLGGTGNKSGDDA